MNPEKFKLSKDETDLLVETTDFGVFLREFLTSIRTSYPNESAEMQVEIARNAVFNLVEKGLVSLCRLTPENTKNRVYEVNEYTAMTTEQVITHLAKPISWEQFTDSEQKEISYELSPTKLGEEMLDYIFSIKGNN
jgi:hypothetical protein